MVYLNLMYRQKAEIDPDNDTREADLKQAEDWVDKALAARKAGTARGSSEAAPSACPVARSIAEFPCRTCLDPRGREQVRPLILSGASARTRRPSVASSRVTAWLPLLHAS